MSRLCCFRIVVVAMVVLAGCATATGGSSGAPTGAPRAGVSLRGGDRIVVPAMTVVQNVAISDRYTFIATPNALGVYDRRFNEWLPPLTRLDGWPLATISVMMADPADPSAVWFAADNIVYHYRAGFDDITRSVLPVRVSPNAFFVDASDVGAGVIVGGATGYMRVSPTGFVGQYLAAPGGGIGGARGRIVPQTVASVYLQYPSLQNFERLLTRDNALRTWPVMSAASSATNSEVWLGTAGGGAFKVDPIFARAEQIPFGLIGEGAGAVARAPDGVWFGSLGSGLTARGGITFADNELKRWRWLDGGTASPLANARVTSISAWGATLWIASDRGVVHLDARTGDVLRRWDDMSGLPNAVALAVEATFDGAWVGTMRGLAFVRDTGRASRATRSSDVDASMLTGSAVRSLARRGDTLWIASDAGMFVLPPDTPQPRRLRAASTDQRLNLPVAAVATADSVVAIATADGDVLRINTTTGDVIDQVSYVNTARVGRVYALAMDAATLWVAGARGVIVTQRSTGVQRYLSAGADLPPDAFGVALTAQYAWIATRHGAVRLRRLDDGSVR